MLSSCPWREPASGPEGKSIWDLPPRRGSPGCVTGALRDAAVRPGLVRPIGLAGLAGLAGPTGIKAGLLAPRTRPEATGYRASATSSLTVCCAS